MVSDLSNQTTAASADDGFGWVIDPDGNRLELWEPPAEMPESDS